MALFGGLFGKKATPTIAPAEQAVLIRLDAVNLPQEIYDQNDLATLEDRLISALQGSGLGEFDGNEVGDGVSTLYLYGGDAEKLFTKIEPVLRNDPLCQQATVTIRKGRPGSEQRELRL